jgi:VanZ family protein
MALAWFPQRGAATLNTDMLKNKKLFIWSAAVIWMAVIFSLSSVRGSGYHSPNTLYFIERKSFHIIEYFILFILFYEAFSRDFKFNKSLAFSAILAFIYGISDEWHQTFVFGREGTTRDAVIDLAGILAALILVSLIKKWKKEKKQLN